MSKVAIMAIFGSRTVGFAAVAVLIAGVAMAARHQSAQPAKIARPLAVEQRVPYTASRFPGVQVRHVPEAAPKAANGATWLGRRPGTVSPRGLQMPVREARTPSTILRGRGTTPLGGTWVAMPPERVPLSVARRKNGKPAVDCLVPSAKLSQPSAKTVR